MSTLIGKPFFLKWLDIPQFNHITSAIAQTVKRHVSGQCPRTCFKSKGHIVKVGSLKMRSNIIKTYVLSFYVQNPCTFPFVTEMVFFPTSEVLERPDPHLALF